MTGNIVTNSLQTVVNVNDAVLPGILGANVATPAASSSTLTSRFATDTSVSNEIVPNAVSGGILAEAVLPSVGTHNEIQSVVNPTSAGSTNSASIDWRLGPNSGSSSTEMASTNTMIDIGNAPASARSRSMDNVRADVLGTTDGMNAAASFGLDGRTTITGSEGRNFLADTVSLSGAGQRTAKVPFGKHLEIVIF